MTEGSPFDEMDRAALIAFIEQQQAAVDDQRLAQIEAERDGHPLAAAMHHRMADEYEMLIVWASEEIKRREREDPGPPDDLATTLFG